MEEREQENTDLVRGPVIRVSGPRSMDQLTVRLAAAGLIMYEAFRHPSQSSFLEMDFAKRTASILRKWVGQNG